MPKLFPMEGTAVQVRRHFQQGEFPSSHHREEGWPSDQENIAQHPLFARTGWCSDRTDKEHHPGGVDKELRGIFLVTPPPLLAVMRGGEFAFFKMTPLNHGQLWAEIGCVRYVDADQHPPAIFQL